MLCIGKSLFLPQNLTLGRLYRYFILIAVVFVGVSGCRKQGSGWTVDALLPVANSKIGLQDIFRDSNIVSQSDESLMLVYSSNILDFKLNDFEIPDTTFTNSHSNPGIPLVWDKRVPLVSDTNTSTLKLENVDLLEAKILSGSIDVKVTSVISEDIRVIYTMPAAKKNGSPLEVTKVIPGASLNSPAIITDKINLTDYVIDLKGIDKNEYNTIYYYFKVEFVDLVNPDTVYQYKVTDYVDIEQRFNQIKPEYGKGVFHTQTQSADSTTTDSLDVFENVIGGSIDLAQARVNLSFDNYVGADIQGNVLELSSINSETGKKATLKGDVIGKSINITRAQEVNWGIYPPINPTHYTYQVNQDNSNIDELIEIFPDGFKYNVDFTLNPDGNVSGGNDFLYSEYGIKASLDLEIPLDFAADSLTFVDTTEVNPETIEEFENVFGGMFHVYCDNWYPFDAELRIVFIDDLNQPLMEVLLPNSNIKAGIVGDNGKVEHATRTKISAPFTPNRLSKYYRTSKALIYVTLNTKDNNQYKVYSHYTCGVKIIADLQYNLDLK